MKRLQLIKALFCKTCQMGMHSLLAGLTMPGRKVKFGGLSLFIIMIYLPIPFFFSFWIVQVCITTLHHANSSTCFIKWTAYVCACVYVCNNKHLMTGPEGNSEFCFPRISMFPSTSSRETLRFEGNKIHCSPRDQSLSDLLYSKTKLKSKI